MPIQAPPAVHTSPFQERLSGEVIVDALGNPAQPSQAMVFETDTPIPTMLVQRELNYLYWLASTLEGKGKVVELGCFLGGSTSALVAGLKNSAHPAQSLLSYDAFVTPPADQPHLKAWLRSYGLEPETRFRDRFDELNWEWIDCIAVRDGWIPDDATLEQEVEIYPEQEPIELLFVDIAKTWGVHLTALRAFGRHLQPGSTLVHQDFFDMHTPWIPLHMWQLRDVLKPLDVIMGTPSVSFRCKSDITNKFDDLFTLPDLMDRAKRREVWDEVFAYWSDLIGAPAAGFLYGHATIHSMYARDGEETARYGRLYDAWSRSSESNGVYFTPNWSDVVACMPDEFEKMGHRSLDVQTLATACTVRGSRLDRPRHGEQTSYYLNTHRLGVWSAALDRLEKSGHKRIALFGAGQHTRWLLSTHAFDKGIELVCILDDAPREDFINGIPLISPYAADQYLGDVSAVLPSTDSFEPQFIARLQALYHDRADLEIHRVYTHPEALIAYPSKEGNECPEWRYRVDTTQPKSPLHPHCKNRVALPSVPDRALLGLQPERAWLEDFYSRYTVPDWAQGHTYQPEGAFLWDMIESIRPRRVVEIGTASGVSTALLLGAINEFCGVDSLVYSYDIASCCYFDSNRPLASALGEMAPDLVARVRLYAQADAVDAASCFQTGEVEFAFIDGAHAHPLPTLDLLALLYALRPGSWVALHDIELPHIESSPGESEWEHNTGAKLLFDTWPYEKLSATGTHPATRNIGAIRMPMNLECVVPHLLSLLCKPWETHRSADPLMAKALSSFAEFER